MDIRKCQHFDILLHGFGVSQFFSSLNFGAIHNYLVHKNSTIVARYTVISNTIHYVRIIYISCYTTKCVMLNGDCHFNMYLYYTIYHIWVLLRCHGTYSVMCNGEWKSVECVVWTQAFVQIQILCIRHVDSWVINNDRTPVRNQNQTIIKRRTVS